MGDEMVELREQVRAQQALIEQQAGMIERLEEGLADQGERLAGQGERLAAVEHRETPAAGSGGEDGLVMGDETTDRRHLLSKAATVAAGAVVGGTALALGQASPAAAAQGIFDGNPAVQGTANPSSGAGVRGDSATGFGVAGYSTVNSGVYGYADSGFGVQGATDSGFAVIATAQFDDSTHLLLYGTPASPPTSAVYRRTGSVVRDVNNDLWLCIAGGTPGVWRRVSGANTAGAFTILAAPVRVYDSRPNFPPAVGTKAKLVGGVARSCDLTANSSGVPSGATAVLVNLVATGTTGAGGGFLAVYANGIAWPGTSNVNWSGPGQNVAVTTLTAVDTAAVCNLYANVATDVVVDVIGYYR